MTPGTKLGPYEILALIGVGGMGEVYRARDTKLKREVAIKILPEEFSRDRDRVNRFQREAEVLASLNHPNIAAIYDLQEAGGAQFLVLELVEGETLADRIAGGPIPVEEALNIAKSISEALEAAHERGIIHRDLKPANVKVTPDGKVKVLDFGLAKSMDNAPASTMLTNSPTMLSGTMGGIILGTAAYMSPEQARGKPVDKRTDIWAWGVVLYELLTGERMFKGDDAADTLAQVLTKEPDLDRVPPQVRKLLRRCLEKDPKRRLRDIGDAMGIIENAPEARPASSRVVWTLAAAAAVFAVAFTALSFVHFRETPPEGRVMITSINAPENTTFAIATINPPALSPDGRQIAFSARSVDGKSQLWLRPLDSVAAQPLAGTEGATFPFWSPDSRSIAFFADGKLKRIGVARGPVLTLADAPLANGGSWSPQDVIVFSPNILSPLQRVAVAGGLPSAATTLDPAHAYYHALPWFLPDGRHFLFADQTQPGGREFMLQIGALDSQEVKTIGPANSNALYSSGYLLYVRQNTLMAQPFDEKRLAVDGEPQPIAEQIANTSPPASGPAGAFSVARDGLLVYRTEGVGHQQLTWFDRSGKPVGTLGDAGDFASVEFSPDRKRLAVSRSGQSDDIWIYDVARGLPTRVTFSSAAERVSVWSPDGRSIIYGSNSKGPFDLYRRAADGTGNEELLYADEANKIAQSWSPDGKFLLFFRVDRKTLQDIWVLPVGAPAGPGPTPKPLPWLAKPFREAHSKFSPDGHWVAYESNESGRFEIYVAPFPGPGGKTQVSAGGGGYPRWRPDGKEVFYEMNGTLMAADVSVKGANVEVGAVRSLGIPVTAPDYLYDVSLDGQRFLVAVPLAGVYGE